MRTDKVLHTQPVQKSPQASPLPEEPRNFEDFKLQREDGSTIDLAGWIAQGSTDGLVVLKDGKVLYEGCFRGNEASSKHIMMSMTVSEN